MQHEQRPLKSKPKSVLINLQYYTTTYSNSICWAFYFSIIAKNTLHMPQNKGNCSLTSVSDVHWRLERHTGKLMKLSSYAQQTCCTSISPTHGNLNIRIGIDSRRHLWPLTERTLFLDQLRTLKKQWPKASWIFTSHCEYMRMDVIILKREENYHTTGPPADQGNTFAPIKWEDGVRSTTTLTQRHHKLWSKSSQQFSDPARKLEMWPHKVLYKNTAKIIVTNSQFNTECRTPTRYTRDNQRANIFHYVLQPRSRPTTLPYRIELTGGMMDLDDLCDVNSSKV